MAAAIQTPARREPPRPEPVRAPPPAPPRKADHLRLVVPVAPVPAGLPAERKLVGVLAIFATCAMFAASDTVSKVLTATLPPIEIAWLRYLVFVMVTAPMLLRGPAMLRTARPGLLAGRAVASATSTLVAIVSFSLLPVALATSIGFVAPVVVTALAALVLKERVGWHRWAAACVGLAGVAIIVQPGTGAFQLATLLPLAGALASASATVATRMARTERTDTTLFYAAVVGFALLSVLVLFCWRTPTPTELALGAVVGVFAALASLAQVLAYRYAPASLLQPFSYTQLVWAGGFGFLVFGNVPGVAMAIGSAVIAASGIYTAWREGCAGRAPIWKKRSPRAAPLATKGTVSSLGPA